MKRNALALALIVGVLQSGCGSADPALFPDSFDGTFNVKFVPIRIECRPATAQVQITGLQLAGSGMSGETIRFTVTGTLNGSISDRSVQIDARASSINSMGPGLQMTGTALKREGGVSLTGNYSDSNECDGTWASTV